MKIFITGGTGFVGSFLAEKFVRAGHGVSILTRSASKAGQAPANVTIVEGDSMKPGPWQKDAGSCDVAVNLAGASIFTYWTEKARVLIMDSRVLTTRHLVDALRSGGGKKLLLSASAVGYYGSEAGDAVLDENSPAGADFLAQVGRQWETEALKARDFGARVVLCRFGIVLGRNGGALAKMVPSFKRWLGSALGSGKQWFPWIHEDDLLQIMLFLMDHQDVSGPVNCTAPFPVRNEELTRALAGALHRPLFLPAVPAFILKNLLGEFGDVLLKGQRAIPRILQENGFRFRFPTIQQALEHLLG